MAHQQEWTSMAIPSPENGHICTVAPIGGERSRGPISALLTGSKIFEPRAPADSSCSMGTRGPTMMGRQRQHSDLRHPIPHSISYTQTNILTSALRLIEAVRLVERCPAHISHHSQCSQLPTPLPFRPPLRRQAGLAYHAHFFPAGHGSTSFSTVLGSIAQRKMVSKSP